MIKPIDASDKITLTRGLNELGVSVSIIGSFLDELDDQKTVLFICPKSFCHYWFNTDQSITAYIGNAMYEATDVKPIAARVLDSLWQNAAFSMISFKIKLAQLSWAFLLPKDPPQPQLASQPGLKTA